MAQITWRNVSAPGFSGNASNVAAIRSIGAALDKANIFNTISQDRSNAFDTAVQTEQDAFQRQSDILSNDNIRQQMGLAVNQDTRAAEEARLANLETQFTLENQPDVLASQLATAESRQGANNAAAGASNARTSVSNLQAGDLRTTRENTAQVQNVEDTILRALTNDPNMPEEELKALARTTAGNSNNPGIAIAGFNNAINKFTAPTNSDIAQNTAAIATTEFERKKELQKLKNKKGGDLDLTDILDTVQGTVGFIEFDSTSRNKFINVVNSVKGQGISNTRIKALANKYINRVGDFDPESFLDEANLLISKAQTDKDKNK